MSLDIAAMDIGIDLGTTFSVIAVNGNVPLATDYPPGTYLSDCDVTIVPTPYGEPSFPSVYMEDPENVGTYLFGTDALQRADYGHAPVMFSKRKIGTCEPIQTLTGAITAKDVARAFLRYLKHCAERALGQPVERAVVTHPAYFDRLAVEETRQAAREAGFDMSLPEQMLMEPVAAALTYTRTDKRDPLRVLTYDLGGGTFDVTFLVRSSGVIEMRAFDGDHLLGGYNFDRELLHWVRQQLQVRGRNIVLDENDAMDRGRLIRLLRIAEQVKIDLAKAPSDATMVEFRARDVLRDTDGRDVAVNERLSRSQFVELIQPYLARTVEACKRALQKAHVGADDLDEVLLVGGSTWAPWVASAVSAAFPRATPRLFYPDLCVGAGAAIHAKLVLPSLVEAAGFRIVLDIPDVAVVSTLNIAGQVIADRSGLALELRLPDASVRPRTPLSPAGHFLFADVELSDEGANRLALRLYADGTFVLEHRFEIRFAPESTETSSVTTVLPKPLFVETYDGLVPLAAEGSPLPAKISQTFQRQNDNPSISLRLFQDHDPIGELRIENIPPGGGRGSFVDLIVEVTATNQLRGTAQVRTQEGRIVVQSDVRVDFEAPKIPSIETLRERFAELRDRAAELSKGAESSEDRLSEFAAPVVSEIERLLSQQPLERQEVHTALRRLNLLLNPPQDDMRPTLAEFRSAAQRYRRLLTELERHTGELLAQAGRERKPAAIDEKAVASAERIARRATHYRALIDKYEREGIAAHQRRDRKGWARIYDALTDLELQVRTPSPRQAPPTRIAKLFASFEVIRHLAQLDAQTERLRAAGRLDDWSGELDRIRHGIEVAGAEIEAINDDLPSDQAHAQVQRIVTRSLQPLKEAIDRLGVDISRVGR
jgi:molecular chaperone DnaK (HSP70)